MMRAVASAILLLVGSIGAALGAPAPAADAKAVAQCIDAARNGDGFGGNCIGVLADPCIEAVSSRDPYADAKACAARELAVWQARLTRAVAATSKGAGSPVRAAVAAAQKSWASSQEALCPLLANLDPGMAAGADIY